MLNRTLKELRRRRGITQEQLADVLGVERSSVGKYEAANKPVTPSSDVLIKMAQYFRVSIDFLLRSEDAKEPVRDDINLDELEFALYGEVRELGAEDKEELIRMAKRMRELEQLRRASRK